MSSKKLLLESFADIQLRTDCGVYLIDDRYIGESDDFNKRVKQHINSPNKGGHNVDLTNYITEKFKNGEKIQFKQISTVQKAEVDFIKKYSINHELLNKQGMPTTTDLHYLRRRREHHMDKAVKIVEIERLSVERLHEKNSGAEVEKQEDVYLQMLKKEVFLYLTNPNMRESLSRRRLESMKEIKNEITEREFNGEPYGIPDSFWNVNIPVVEEQKSELIIERDTSSRNETFAR